MNGMMGWIIAAVVVIAAGVFYFWPQIMQAPATTEQGTGQEQGGIALTENPDIPGTWRSNTDAKFTREIRTDGVIIDRYEGDNSAGIGGGWSAVADVTAEPLIASRAASLAGMTVIKVVWEGGVETTYFVINSLTDTSMTTTDLTGTGSVTTYTRI